MLGVTGVAFGQIPDFRSDASPTPAVGTYEAKAKKVKRDVQVRKLPPLRLPNIEEYLKPLARADRKGLVRQQVASSRVLAFWEGKGRWLRALRHEKCWEVPWQRSCTIARASVRLHVALNDLSSYRLEHELPMTNDWQTAVRIAQRLYPGTEDWMLSISDREGGWSAWVWYGGRRWSGYHVGDDFLGADTVGGWMQFRFSTFAPYYRGMVKDLRARGITVPSWPDRGGPEIYQPWLDPLGQALTAGYMRFNGLDGCHWCL